jgi:peptidoglycan/LPS O-acetylase OafA/YrhL
MTTLHHSIYGREEPDSAWLLDSDHRRRIVDGLRAIGIMLVVAFHCAILFTRILPRPEVDAFMASLPGVFNVVWQALGSELVFFTSGFLLSYLLLREHARRGSIDKRAFWIARAARILPLFLLAMCVFLIGRTLHWDRILANLLFSARIAGYFEITPHAGKNIIPVGWSLEVMVHAYFALPFLVLGVLRTRWPLIAALALAALSVLPRLLVLAADPAAYTLPAYRFVDGVDVPQVHKDLYYLTWFRLTPFLLGLAAAVAVTHHRAALERWCALPWRAPATLAAGLMLVAASAFLPLQRKGAFVYDLFGPREWLWFWSCQRAVLIVGMALVLLTVLVASRGAPALLGRGLAWRAFTPVSHGIYAILLFHFLCLVPAALVVFLPAVVEGIARSPSFARAALTENIRASIASASVWQYLVMVVLTVWLSTRLAGFLARVVEAPVQRWRRTRSAAAAARPSQAPR